MRQRLSSLGTLLLVVVVVLVGLTACERSAKERESEATEAAELTPSGATAPVVEASPAPGETVVSAVTSTAGSQATPTLVPIGGSPVAQEPTATTAPAAAATPAPTSAASEGEQPPSGSAEGYVWHTVQRGESLSSIARRYGTTWQAIAQANGIVNPNQIYAGQKLKIPTTGGPSGGTADCRIRHTVKSGEWVWQIAREYGVSPYDILAANGLTIQSANTIYPGKVLCIP